MPTILVVNPNSSPRITEQIADAVATVPRPEGVEVRVVTSTGGPAAIESNADVMSCVAPMAELVLADTADAYVIACFSDPGIEEIRTATGKPVFGIAESAMLGALARGFKVGVVSSVEPSVARHEAYWKKRGLDARVVADIAVGRGVLDLATADAFDDVVAVGHRLVDEFGVDAVVLGCAGMTHMRSDLQKILGVPVVDPCRAAITAAFSAVLDSTEVFV